MERYKRVWPWMIIPLIVMQMTIFVDYWGDFASNTWAVHVHYWLATVWYLFLISQPWLFAKGNIATHRTWGIIGIFVAGGFAFTSISQLNRDLVYADYVSENPGGIGPFEAWFFMGIAMVEIILITGFIVAVLMAILQRRSLEDHAWWMMSTVFIVMFPAVGRGFQAIAIAIYGFSPEITVVVMPPILLGQLFILGLILIAAWLMARLRHPATFLALGVNAAGLFLEPLGRNEALQVVLRSMIAA